MVHYRKKNIFYILYAVFCVLCPVFFLTACVTPEELGRVQWEVNELKTSVRDIKNKNQILERQKPGQEAQYSKRLSGLETEQKATSTAVSDMLIKVQSLTTDVSALTGRLDETRNFYEKNAQAPGTNKDLLTMRVQELETAVNALKDKVARLESAEKQTAVPDSGKADETATTGAEETKRKMPDQEVKDLYLEAYKAYKADDFEGARDKFQALLKNYAENEYSDNARFWIAESYYKEKNYEDAILAYEDLLKKNSKSDKVPGAMLKQGLAFYELNDKKTGKIVLEKLIERFPGSDEAAIAGKKIGAVSPSKSPATPTKKK